MTACVKPMLCHSDLGPRGIEAGRIVKELARAEAEALRARAERAEAALEGLAACIHREDDGLGTRWWYELAGWREVTPALDAARAVLADRDKDGHA